MTMPQNIDLDAVNEQLADASPTQIIQWAVDTFGDDIMLTSSFGVGAAVMLHLVSSIKQDVSVVAIDTGYLFPETYQFANQLTEQLGLNVHWFAPRLSTAHIEAVHGRLWEKGDAEYDQYFQLTKGEPMARALKQLNAKAWIAGLGAKQTAFRATLRAVELQGDTIKIHPILKWTAKEKYEYRIKHNLPEHPLHDKGYATVGDTHSSRPITADDKDERDTRFHGLRQECGLHLPTNEAEEDSRHSSGL